MDAQKRARRWWGANIPGSMIKATAVLISQAEQDERRKVWLEAAAWVEAHCTDRSPDRWMGPEATVEKFRALAEEVT